MNGTCEECWDWTLENLKDILKFKFKNKLPSNLKKEQLQLPMSDEEEKEGEPLQIESVENEKETTNKKLLQSKIEEEL